MPRILQHVLTLVMGLFFGTSYTHNITYDLTKELYKSAPWAAPYRTKNIIPWVYVDFDESMQTTMHLAEIEKTTDVVSIDASLLYHSLKGLYNKNNLSNILPAKELKIPKIIHQIWFGSAVPECFKAYMASWVEFHLDDWQYMLWTEKEIAELNLYNKQYYDQTDNCAVKADLARLEILYQYGGVYVDVDCECLRPLDILHYTYDFYIGIQPLDSKFLQLNNSIIGSRAAHPILKHSIETIQDDWHKKGACQKTGPIHVIKSFYLMADIQGNTDIALPASYFYPLGCTHKNIEKELWQDHDAFCVHWWAKSWMSANYRPKQFRSIKNEDSTHNWNK